jgi:nucleotide-binding universal stress UspA family protein
MKILLAVDGSKASLGAVKFVTEHADWYRQKPALELVTVHLPVPKLRGMGAAVGKAQIEKYYEEEGEHALADARRQLERAGMAYEARVLVGPVAETLVAHAEKCACDLLCIGSKGRSELGKALMGSTATKVLQISDVPVLLVK